MSPYMERCSLLSVQRLRDKHVAADGVYVVDAARGLIGACSGDAVANANVLVLIGADLWTEPDKPDSTERKICFSILPCQACPLVTRNTPCF